MATESAGEAGSIDAAGNFVPAKGPGFFQQIIHLFLAVIAAIVILFFFFGLLWGVTTAIDFLMNLFN